MFGLITRRYLSQESGKRLMQTIPMAANSPVAGWAKHGLAMPRKARTSRFKKDIEIPAPKPEFIKKQPTFNPEPKVVQEEQIMSKKPRRQLKPRKALITLSPNAVAHLQALLNQPVPQMIRIGVRNRGCSGLTYHLDYVEKPGKFDEVVEQDGVKVIIDSKALFSIVGSEMDWLDDKLSSRFIFRNPNSKGTCGCGESFMV
ncbi:hypothetical protein DIURU_002684 [Diutina rugosa]|uniref:Iron-sulfur assembly protein 1 n=1 Tax=Diutina rugosa TaxID=5481 RepID=A0A642UPA1_DIURU|nr:uncharacterized protein DIURU_002684 [Diutina rugosa]KAA8902788.1 hypothetical protein DIURU_002684 [Diutina rugosa]